MRNIPWLAQDKACPKTPLMLLNEFAAQNTFKLEYDEKELHEDVGGEGGELARKVNLSKPY
eukprot:3789414-Pyramimonas_sp.AAC.1